MILKFIHLVIQVNIFLKKIKIKHRTCTHKFYLELQKFFNENCDLVIFYPFIKYRKLRS